MSWIPLNYEQINLLSGTRLASVYHTKNTEAFDFWCRAFYQRLINGLQIKTPWFGDVKDFFNFCLYGIGFVAVFKSESYGISFQPCTLSGYDFYYRPTNAIISNPVLSANYEIGKDCVLLKLTPDFMSTFDIIYYYAEKMAELDCALKISINNEKNPKFYGAKNKACAESIKKMMDKVNEGNPLQIYDVRLFKGNENIDLSDEPIKLYGENAKDYYMTDKILSDMWSIISRFDTEIGIPSLPYHKKERLVADEANSNMIDSQSRLTTWFETLSSSMQFANAFFKQDLFDVKVRWDFVTGKINSNRVV